jgi:hypothetical protein
VIYDPHPIYGPGCEGFREHHAANASVVHR